MFDFLRRGRAVHLKRAEVLLREAHLARIEHQAAAEHHAALAEMYAQRALRLERELDAVQATPWHELTEAAPVLDDAHKVRHVPFPKPDRIERR